MAEQIVRADRRVLSLRITAARWRVRQAHRMLILAAWFQDWAYEALVDLEEADR